MEYIIDSGKLVEIAEGLIGELPELSGLESVSIGYQRGLGKKKAGGQAVYADCRKVPEWLGEFCRYDYVITFYESADSLTEEGLTVLMHHELLHIQVDEDGKRKVRPHDLQDFRAITDVYGVNWVEAFGRQMRMEMEGKS